MTQYRPHELSARPAGCLPSLCRLLVGALLFPVGLLIVFLTGSLCWFTVSSVNNAIWTEPTRPRTEMKARHEPNGALIAGPSITEYATAMQIATKPGPRVQALVDQFRSSGDTAEVLGKTYSYITANWHYASEKRDQGRTKYDLVQPAETLLLRTSPAFLTGDCVELSCLAAAVARKLKVRSRIVLCGSSNGEDQVGHVFVEIAIGPAAQPEPVEHQLAQLTAGLDQATAPHRRDPDGTVFAILNGRPSHLHRGARQFVIYPSDATWEIAQ
jgi:hypothetical protein